MKTLTIAELDKIHFENALKSSRSLFQTTSAYMKQYMEEFGPASLATLFNNVTKNEPDDWRAGLEATKEEMDEYFGEDRYEGINYGNEVRKAE
jgi:hypothetical protein